MSGQTSGGGPRGLPAILEGLPRRLDNFQIMTWNGDADTPPIPLEPTDVQHSVIAAAVHFALLLLEGKGGRAALNKVGVQIGEHHVPKDFPPDRTSHPLIKDMELLVNYFLVRLRSGFCNLVITGTDSWACFLNPRTRTRGGDYQYTGPDDFDPESYDPKDVGAVLVDNSFPGLLDDILRAQKCIEEDSGGQRAQNALRQFKRNMLALSLIMMHEIGHVFNAFVTSMYGSRMRAHTPDNVFFSPYTGYFPDEQPSKPNPSKVGEAGKVLEYYAWGGMVQLKANKPTENDSDHYHNFVWSRVVLKAWVDGAYKYRVIPDDLVEKFFDAPEVFPLADALINQTVIEDGDPGDNDDDAADKLDSSHTSAAEGHLWQMVGDRQMAAYRDAPTFSIEDEEAIKAFIMDPRKRIPVKQNST